MGGASNTVTDALEQWAADWSNRDAEAYLAHYTESFVPRGGQSRAAWAAERRERITRPDWIRVTLEEIRVARESASAAVVYLWQTFESDGYADRTRKRFDLVRHGDRWLIAAELNLEIQRIQ